MSRLAEEKRQALERIMEDAIIGYLDPGSLGLLELLNKPARVVTLSSCTGRVTLVAGRRPWSRREAYIAFKTHDPVTIEDVERVLSRGFRDLWLKATGPILHVKTDSMDCALHMLSLARPYGFKHSGIISAGDDGVVVEFMSAVDITAPLVVGGVHVVASLGELVELVNEAVRDARQLFYEFARQLSSHPGPCG